MHQANQFESMDLSELYLNQNNPPLKPQCINHPAMCILHRYMPPPNPNCCNHGSHNCSCTSTVSDLFRSWYCIYISCILLCKKYSRDYVQILAHIPENLLLEILWWVVCWQSGVTMAANLALIIAASQGWVVAGMSAVEDNPIILWTSHDVTPTQASLNADTGWKIQEW